MAVAVQMGVLGSPINVSTLPTAAATLAGRVYYNTTDGLYYQVVDGAWQTITDGKGVELQGMGTLTAEISGASKGELANYVTTDVFDSKVAFNPTTTNGIFGSLHMKGKTVLSLYDDGSKTYIFKHDNSTRVTSPTVLSNSTAWRNYEGHSVSELVDIGGGNYAILWNHEGSSSGTTINGLAIINTTEDPSTPITVIQSPTSFPSSYTDWRGVAPLGLKGDYYTFLTYGQYSSYGSYSGKFCAYAIHKDTLALTKSTVVSASEDQTVWFPSNWGYNTTNNTWRGLNANRAYTANFTFNEANIGTDGVEWFTSGGITDNGSHGGAFSSWSYPQFWTIPGVKNILVMPYSNKLYFFNSEQQLLDIKIINLSTYGIPSINQTTTNPILKTSTTLDVMSYGQVRDHGCLSLCKDDNGKILLFKSATAYNQIITDAINYKFYHSNTLTLSPTIFQGVVTDVQGSTATFQFPLAKELNQ